jgi:Zn-dependent peptidase ImmA (M78 family)
MPEKPTPPQVVDFIPKEEIENAANKVLERIEYSEGSVSLERVCASEPRLTVFSDIGPQDHVEGGVLGRITFDPLEISIYRQSDYNPGRQRFTLAHELGHFFLNHSRFLKAEYCEAADFEIDDRAEYDDVLRLEWQANYFASCLLLPRDTLRDQFLKLARQYGLRNRGFGVLFLDEQPCNQSNYYLITNQLKAVLRVSRIALKLRLEDIGIINDVRGKRPPLAELNVSSINSNAPPRKPF